MEENEHAAGTVGNEDFFIMRSFGEFSFVRSSELQNFIHQPSSFHFYGRPTTIDSRDFVLRNSRPRHLFRGVVYGQVAWQEQLNLYP